MSDCSAAPCRRFSSGRSLDSLPPQIAGAIDRLLNHKDLTIQDAEVITNALGHFRKRPALGFSDCLVLEIARKAGHTPLGTFDRDFAKLDGAKRLQ
jgi:predicted nucleic-acid-binding protein